MFTKHGSLKRTHSLCITLKKDWLHSASPSIHVWLTFSLEFPLQHLSSVRAASTAWNSRANVSHASWDKDDWQLTTDRSPSPSPEASSDLSLWFSPRIVGWGRVATSYEFSIALVCECHQNMGFLKTWTQFEGEKVVKCHDSYECQCKFEEICTSMAWECQSKFEESCTSIAC